MNERIVALDIGDVRIGVAVSDERRIIAQPHSVIKRVGYAPDVACIKALCDSLDTVNVLAGLPLNMDGTRGGQAQKVLAFTALLTEAGLCVFFQDERLSTVSAESALIEGNMSRSRRKEHVDKVAAAVILQRWLDGASNSPTVYYRNEGYTMQDKDRVIELIDEQGAAVTFEHLMTLPYQDAFYVVLIAVETDDDSDEEEVVILRIEKDEDGEDCYVTIDDDSEAQAVYDLFIEAIEDEDMPDSDDEDAE